MLDFGTNRLDGCPSPTLMLKYGTTGLDGRIEVSWYIDSGAMKDVDVIENTTGDSKLALP
ncbi:MAG: hypothetical protein HN348_18770 [Proteobacteria bacterium]|jgi:hypothetical protein|nr:hypothetical protein [Pseudomonadota bacterium]